MREILFRGKEKDSGKWIYGDLRHISDGHGGYILCIVDNTSGKNNDVTGIEAIPETVGQYTGLTDKSGTMVFEGDILRDDDAEENGVVVFEEGEFCVVFGNVETHGIADITCGCYVNGNIHNNPELEV